MCELNLKLSDETGFTEEKIREILDKTGSIMRLEKTGVHYELISGVHTADFICFSRIAQWPFVISDISDDMVRWIKTKGFKAVNTILTHSNRSLVLAFDVAKTLNGEMNSRIVEALIDEEGQTTTELRPGQRILEGEKVVIVASLTTTGKSIYKLADIVKMRNADLEAICIFGTRGDEGVVNVKNYLSKLFPNKEIPVYTIVTVMDWETFPKKDCPMCKKDIPFVYSRDTR